jgi:putative transposase
MTTRKAYKYRLYGNKATTEKLQWTLARARELYNAGLQERKEAYQACVKRHPNYYDPDLRKQLTQEHAISCYGQINALPEIKEIRPEYQDIGAHVLQDVLRRLDKAFKKFFQRVQNGEHGGFPRYKGCNRFDSFTFPDAAGWKLLDDASRPLGKKGMVKVRLRLSRIGTVKLHLHRDLVGKVKTLTIKREGEAWFVVFSCEIEKPDPLPVSYEDAGIDLGIAHFAALSNGECIESPKHYRRAEKKLKKLQEALSRKKRSSHRRARAVRVVAKAHRKVRNQRTDFLHKESRKLVNRYQVIVFEDLKVANLTRRPKPKQDEETGQYLPNGVSAKTGLNKSINDAGWSSFVELCAYKAAWAGRTHLQVSPRQTSQICPKCGAVRKKTLEERWHSCECGCELDRDTASAQVILRLGHQLLAGARPTQATA